MNKQEFLTTIRRHGGQFRADKIVVATGQEKLTGNGVVRVANGVFRIEVILDDATKAPDLPAGIHGRSDFWTISGVIDNGIHFRLSGLPHRSSKHWGAKEQVTLMFSTSRLELEPSGFDRMTHQEITEQLENVRVNLLPEGQGVPLTKVTTEQMTPPAQTSDPSIEVCFEAVIPDFKLIAHNGGTDIIEKNDFLGERSRSSWDTFFGEVQEWQFGLIQREDDLHVHLRSKPGYHSQGEIQDEQRFQAFLNALAFIHGQHAWPFSIEHRRDGKLVHDCVQLHKAVARTLHAPFSERLAFSALAGQLSWDFQEVLQTICAFFRSDSKLSCETTHLLYLCREAGSANVPYRITLLSLCNLLESLIQAIYAERIKPQKLAETAAFEAAKQQVCDDLKQKSSQLADPVALQRILAILSNAESTNARIKFDSVVEHLGLKPEDDWRRLFKLWQDSRNPLSHRLAENDESEQSVKEDMAAESNIAGAINCMVLKLIGYSGYVQRSAFEDRYVVI